jgi:regulator of protease activity HflC (stomatin/prohibitin superfamily)
MKDNIFKNIPLLLFILFILIPILGKRGILFLLIAFAIYSLYKKLNIKDLAGAGPPPERGEQKNMSQTIDVGKLQSMQNAKKVLITFIIAILGLWLFFASIVIVDAGETGVYSLFGKVKDEELRSGFHLVIPLAKVTKMSIRTEEYTMSIISGEGKVNRADAITALTKEGLNVDLDMTVLYHLNEEKASDVYKDVGLTYEGKVIRPEIRSAIREIIAQYEAKDIYSEKREEAAQNISDKLKENLDPRGIVMESVLLRNVQLPANLANAIQEKLQAEQEAQKYDFILQKEEKEKERKVIEAEGQEEAQRIINRSLTTNYLYYLYVNQLKDREGTIYVPTSPSTGMPLFRDIGR